MLGGHTGQQEYSQWDEEKGSSRGKSWYLFFKSMLAKVFSSSLASLLTINMLDFIILTNKNNLIKYLVNSNHFPLEPFTIQSHLDNYIQTSFLFVLHNGEKGGINICGRDNRKGYIGIENGHQGFPPSIVWTLSGIILVYWTFFKQS